MEKIKEPFLEPILRKIRFSKAKKFITTDSVVVDIGCGVLPRFLLEVEKIIEEGRGVDNNAKGFDNGKIKVANDLLEKSISLPDSFADHVTVIAVLEHLTYPSEIIGECWRILVAGGTIIITTPAPIGKPILETLSKAGLISKREIDEHKNYFRIEDLCKLLTNNKFEIVKSGSFLMSFNNYIVGRKV